MNSFTSILTSVLLILLIGFCAPKTSPQQSDNKIKTGIISGQVFDKLTNKPIEFVQFVVTSVKDSSVFYHTETDSQGYFIVNKIPFGIYKAKVSLIGYQSRTRKNIILSPVKNEIKIDTIMLMPVGITKKDIEIIAQKERIVYDKDDKNKIIINPDKDWGVNALELLENTPLINVDFDEKKITMMGKSDPLIYVNGLPGRYSGIEGVEDLKFLSTDEIDKFELVVDPASEYGISADGGVLNIIVKKSHKTSFTGNSTLGGNSNNRYNGDINGRYNIPTATASLSYDNSYSNNKTNNSLSRQLTFGEFTNTLSQSGETDNKNISNRYRLYFSLGSPDKFNMSNYINYNEGYNTTNRILNNFYSGNNYNNINYSKNILKLVTEGFSLVNPITVIGYNVASNFMFTNNLMNIENNYNQRKLISYQSLSDTVLSGNDRSNNKNNIYYWSFQFGNRSVKDYHFDASYNGSYKDITMNSDYFQKDSLNGSDAELSSKMIRQRYYENSHSLNLGISGNVLNFGCTLNLRANLKNSQTDNLVTNNSYKNNFISFDPMIMVGRSLFKNGFITLNYSSNTQFPQNYQLNPYVNYSDSTNLISGNPDLKPVSSNVIMLQYFNMDTNITIQIGGNYSHYKNQVSSVTKPISSIVTMTTYANVASTDQLSLDIYLSKKFFNCLELNPHFTINRSKYSDIGINSEGTGWSSALNSTLLFSNLRFQMNFNYSSPAVTVQSKTNPSWYVDAAAKILFLHKTLSITLRAADLFNTRNNNSNTYSPGLFISNNIKQTTRIISLSLSYYFRIEAKENIEQDKPLDVLPEEF
jgi:hypothetical protein